MHNRLLTASFQLYLSLDIVAFAVSVRLVYAGIGTAGDTCTIEANVVDQEAWKLKMALGNNLLLSNNLLLTHKLLLQIKINKCQWTFNLYLSWKL